VVWFKVDDRFHHHPKAIAAGPAAIGLWTLAGSWSADHLTDGFIPRHCLASITPDPHRARLAKRLVAAGLWDEVPGEGWQFHDWGDEGRQRTSEQVKAERKATRERQARFRESRRNGVTNASVTPSVTRESQRPHHTTPIYGVDAVTDPERRGPNGAVENPSRFTSSNPAYSPAGRHPSARPLADAQRAAGLEPGHQPARGQTVASYADQIRQAITQAQEPS
jgi:hypothetical protein